jgi:CTP:molybdopterin cytidylyltransferase MocA
VTAPSDATRTAVTIAGVVLAAGRSSRLGHPKQLLADAHGEPLVRRSARLLREAGCSPVVVVTGAWREEVAAAVSGCGYELVHNANFGDGMGTSIAAAVEYLECSDAAAILISSCDMPEIESVHYSALIQMSAHGGKRVASGYPDRHDGGVAAASVTATAEPVRGIPALLPRADWPSLRALTGDVGARGLLRDAATLTVFVRGGTFDLDTPDDVAQWRERHSPPDTP